MKYIHLLKEKTQSEACGQKHQSLQRDIRGIPKITVCFITVYVC